MQQPIQPILKDKDDALKFQENAIIRFLINSGKANLNELYEMPFSDEDFCQFAQLAGYSINGYFELPFVSDEHYGQIEQIIETGDIVKVSQVDSYFVSGEYYSFEFTKDKHFESVIELYPSTFSVTAIKLKLIEDGLGARTMGDIKINSICKVS